MKTLLLASLLLVSSVAGANQAADQLARMQQQQHIWASQRHQAAERSRVYQEGLQRSRNQANRVYSGQAPIIGTQPRSNLYGY